MKSKLNPYRDDIIDRYCNQRQGLKTISKYYHCDKKTLKNFLVKNGIKIRELNHVPYSFDEGYFDCINSSNKAYILGMLYADGANVKQYNAVKLSLASEDRAILEKIREEMKVEKPLLFYERSKRNSKWKDVYELKIYSKHICEQLEILGCTPRKSLTLTFPNFLSDDLMPHFIRGYFDGDGCICISKSHIISSFVSSTDFCIGLHNYLQKIGIACKLCTLKTNEHTSRIIISKKSEIKKLMNYMYKDADLYMDRKHNTFLNIFGAN